MVAKDTTAIRGTEYEWAAYLLSEMVDEFEGHTASEIFIPSTDANKAILAAVEKYRLHDNTADDEETANEDNTGELAVLDYRLMEYLADRCNKLSKSREELSAEELQLTAQMLDMLADDDYHLYDQSRDNDLHLPANAHNQRLVAAALELAGKPQPAATDTSLLDVGTVDILRYLACSFRQQSTTAPQFKVTDTLNKQHVDDDIELGIYNRWSSEKKLLKDIEKFLASKPASDVDLIAQLERYSNGADPFYEFLFPDKPLSPQRAALFALAQLVKRSASGLEAARALYRLEPVEVWLPLLAEFTADQYWATRATADSISSTGSYSFSADVRLLAMCLCLGWMKEAESVVRYIRQVYQYRAYSDVEGIFSSPLGHWLLRLCFDYWQIEFDGWGQGKYGTCENVYAVGACFGRPALNELAQNWFNEDLSSLNARLIWLCDFYTHETAAREKAEIRGPLLTRFPALILAALRLRECRQLPLPVINHPLMSGPYVLLPPVQPFYTGDLTERILTRARQSGIEGLENHLLPLPEYRTPPPRDEKAVSYWNELAKYTLIGDGCGLKWTVPGLCLNRATPERLHLVCRKQNVDLYVDAYRNPGLDHKAWLEKAMAQIAASSPKLFQVGGPSEHLSAHWWAMEVEYREGPGDPGMANAIRMLCTRNGQFLYRITLVANAQQLSENRNFFDYGLRSLELQPAPPEAVHAVEPEFQDIPDLQKITWSNQLRDPEIQFHRANEFYAGKGILEPGAPPAPDYAEAASWFRRAAEQGHGRAQYALAMMYLEGLDLPKDKTRALMWLRRAAKMQDEFGERARSKVIALEKEMNSMRKSEVSPWWKFW